MLRLSALALLLTAIGSPMAARAQPAEVFEPSDPDVSDADVIRWAASEVGRATPRPPRPPIPPDDYLGRSAPEGDVRVIDEPDVALRLLAEIGGGSLGALLGGGLGALLVYAVSESDASAEWTLTAVVGGALIGSLGVTGGVTLAADATGGRGNFGHAFLGQAFGAAVALPLVVLALDQDALAVALVAAGVLPLAGAVLGYEIGHGEGAPSAGPSLISAYLAPIPDGLLAGVSGVVD